MPNVPDMDGWGMPLGGPSARFLPLHPSAPAPVPVELESGGRVVDKGKATQADDAARLLKAAKDFEAVFLSQVLKQMRGTVKKEEMFHGGLGEDFFTEMMDEELSKRMASRQSTGIAEMLFRQLSRQYGIESTPPSGAAPGGAGEQKGMPGPTEAADKLRNQLRAVQSEMSAAPDRPSTPDF